MFMAEVFDLYVKKRLLDVALERRAPRKQIHRKMGQVPENAVSPRGCNMYTVLSASDANEV